MHRTRHRHLQARLCQHQWQESRHRKQQVIPPRSHRRVCCQPSPALMHRTRCRRLQARLCQHQWQESRHCCQPSPFMIRRDKVRRRGGFRIKPCSTGWTELGHSAVGPACLLCRSAICWFAIQRSRQRSRLRKQYLNHPLSKPSCAHTCTCTHMHTQGNLLISKIR